LDNELVSMDSNCLTVDHL